MMFIHKMFVCVGKYLVEKLSCVNRACWSSSVVEGLKNTLLSNSKFCFDKINAMEGALLVPNLKIYKLSLSKFCFDNIDRGAIFRPPVGANGQASRDFYLFSK